MITTTEPSLLQVHNPFDRCFCASMVQVDIDEKIYHHQQFKGPICFSFSFLDAFRTQHWDLPKVQKVPRSKCPKADHFEELLILGFWKASNLSSKSSQEDTSNIYYTSASPLGARLANSAMLPSVISPLHGLLTPRTKSQPLCAMRTPDVGHAPVYAKTLPQHLAPLAT